MSSTNGIAIDHGNNRFRDRANLFLYIQHIQSGHSVCSHIASMAFDVHVPTAAESLVACTRQYNYIDVLTFAAIIKRIAYFGCSGRSKRIAVSRTVDCNFGNTVVEFKKNILILFYGFPFSLCHIVVIFLGYDNMLLKVRCHGFCL